MDLKVLARAHQEHSDTLAERPLEELLLWYADLNLGVEGGKARYLCPECGRPQVIPLEEFLVRDNSEDLWCDACRGEPEERGGPMG